jgi:glyoxylase-like metal-dependent hydrolase (beta-lactamase superfamily II)
MALSFSGRFRVSVATPSWSDLKTRDTSAPPAYGPVYNRSVHVGEIRIDPLIDGVISFPATEILRRPGVPDAWNAHRDLLTADGMFEMPVGGFLLRAGERVVLVDTGLGPMDRESYQAGRLLACLAELGLRPEDVTDVLLTHLHFDHVGWVTQKGVVVFPSATYRCHGEDWHHFVTSPDASAGAVRKLSPLEPHLEPFAGDCNIAPGIDVRHAPGHTPGSAIVVISSGPARALLLGDVVHCPIELTEPDWEGMFDVDPQLATQTREALARELEGQEVPAAAAHFPGLQFGRLLPCPGGRRWTYGWERAAE